MNPPLVSIVIPTHNRKAMLVRLIESILSSSYSNIEIIVVDDASNDKTEETITNKYKSNSKVRLLHNVSSLYTAGSRNKGLKVAKGDYIFFIDDDNILDKNAIELMVLEFEKNPKFGELGLVNYSVIHENKILWAGTSRNMFTSWTNQSRNLIKFGTSHIWESDDVPNAFMVRSKIVKKHKIFFKEFYQIMYEESDFAYRIRQCGYLVKVVRNAKIYHDVESSLPGKKNKDYMYHFMSDNRRSYVTARNRIIFHSIFSNKFEFFAIILIWIWLFTAYYSYKILTYSGSGNFSILQKLELIMHYMKGNFDGIMFVRQRDIK